MYSPRCLLRRTQNNNSAEIASRGMGLSYLPDELLHLTKVFPGFLCPVHTPDGSPCGLLNHLSRTCRIVTSPLAVSHVPALLVAQGMTDPVAPSVKGSQNICVQLDGRIIGWATPSVAKGLATSLRIWKTEGVHGIPLDLEIGLVPSSDGGQYPGLFLFASRSRMMRPVKYVVNGKDDQVGSFEQVYMDIAVSPNEIEPAVSTHVEHAPTNFLSILANMTPFSDFNQSPRNIYQCQVRRTTSYGVRIYKSSIDGEANNGDSFHLAKPPYR